MYKALNRVNKQEVIILDPRWEGQIQILRSLDRRDLLVCPGCNQPVRVRAGLLRRWHFAHKHLQNCPYDQASPLLLAARAVLYTWLISKLGEESVRIEKKLDVQDIPRPIDCWIERGEQRIAYWIIDSRMKPGLRNDVKNGFIESEIIVNWIFVYEMLRQDPDYPDCVYLTTTEREFMHRSVYDEIFTDRLKSGGKSLHYLDPNNEEVTTFRSLRLIHAPQLHQGRRCATTLSNLLISPQTGEFVHPGEHDQLQRFRQQEEEKKKTLDIARKFFQRKAVGSSMSPNNKPIEMVKSQSPTQHKSSESNRIQGLQPKEAICVFCGKLTSDWWYFNPKMKQCKCRDCYREGKA